MSDDNDNSALYARIAKLESQLKESNALQVHNYHFAHEALKKTGVKQFMGGAVVLTLTGLGGKSLVDPVAIRDGLSDATIAALQADLIRSFELATLFQPAKSDKPSKTT